MRESFVFFKSFFDAIEELPTKYQPDIYAAVCKYSLYGEVPELTGVAKALFILMKANIDASEKKYIAAIENGKKGGRPKKDIEIMEQTEENPMETERKPEKNPIETQAKPTETETKPKDNLNVNDNDNDNVTDTVNDNEDVNVTATASDTAASAEAFGEAFREEETEEAEEETKTTKQMKSAEEEPIESLPLLNGRDYPIFQSDVEKWSLSYPELDIRAELRRMKDWLSANPKKRKAPMDIQRFITGWFNHELKEQKSNPAFSAGKKPAAQQPTAIGFDLDEFCRSAIARSQEIADEIDRENRMRDQWK